MRSIAAIGLAIVVDAVRRKLVWVAIAFAGLMAVAIPSLPSYGVGVEASVFREVSLALIYVMGMVVGLSLAASRIPAEVERRTVYNVLSRDVQRWQYVFGTWLGISLVLLGCIIAFTVTTQVIAVLRYGSPMWILWQGSLSIWYEVSVIAAFAILLSTIIGPVPVAVASIGVIFVGHLAGGYSAGDLVGTTTGFVPSLDAFNIINPVAHGAGISLLYVGIMTAVFVGWVSVLMLAASLLFERREL